MSAPPRWRSSLDGRVEGGSMTVVLAGVCAMLVVVLIAGSALGGAALTAHRARADADLAALAGAQSEQDLPGSGCATVQEAVSHTSSRLVHCAADTGTGDVLVVVERPVGVTWPGVPDLARARARAGPDPGGEG